MYCVRFVHTREYLCFCFSLHAKIKIKRDTTTTKYNTHSCNDTHTHNTRKIITKSNAYKHSEHGGMTAEDMRMDGWEVWEGMNDPCYHSESFCCSFLQHIQQIKCLCTGGHTHAHTGTRHIHKYKNQPLRTSTHDIRIYSISYTYFYLCVYVQVLFTPGPGPALRFSTTFFFASFKSSSVNQP